MGKWFYLCKSETYVRNVISKVYYSKIKYGERERERKISERERKQISERDQRERSEREIRRGDHRERDQRERERAVPTNLDTVQCSQEVCSLGGGNLVLCLTHV